MTTWVVVLAVGAISYALRAAPLFSPRLAAPSPRTARLFADAGTASLTAIVVLSVRGQVGGFDRDALVVAAAFAAGLWVAHRGRPLHFVVAAGVAAHLALTALVAQF